MKGAHCFVASLFVALVLWAGSARQPSSAQELGELVTLDVVVLDAKGRAVRGLTADDFTIKEDGAPVAVTTFAAVTPDDPEMVRSLVVLMDDVAVPLLGGDAMRTIARALMAGLRPTDEFSVVRLSSRTDEAYGDRPEAVFRIGAYRPGAAAFSDWATPETTLRRIADISRQLESSDGRRKLVVCIGAPVVCNVSEPSPAAARNLWPSWVDAMSAAARANVAVYTIVPGRTSLRGGGLVDTTGGVLFATSYDIGPAIDRIQQDAAHYYLLGYWPHSRQRPLHRIEVKVTRKDVKVLSRSLRGQ